MYIYKRVSFGLRNTKECSMTYIDRAKRIIVQNTSKLTNTRIIRRSQLQNINTDNLIQTTSIHAHCRTSV